MSSMRDDLRAQAVQVNVHGLVVHHHGEIRVRKR